MLHALIAALLILLAPHGGDGTKWPLTSDVPSATTPIESTALARYVNSDDGAYKWELVRTTETDGVTIFDIRLTSQRWRTESEVDFPLWTHWLTVGVPSTLRNTTPIMMIGGGSRKDQPADKARPEFLLLAKSTGAVVCAVDNVPNQPLKLRGDTEPRREDDLLSQSWNLAMQDDDALWIGRFPMVKSVKRAMDATDEFLSSRELPAKLKGTPLTKGFKPDGYFITGASKRGWTAWLIAAVDPRVKAVAPIVIDVLNMRAHTPHHFAAYGFWAPALHDYIKNGIAEKFGSPELAKVIAHEDPAAYLPALTNTPKYIVTATGDEFFPTDSFRHYESLLTGEWHLRSVPNAGHNLKGSNAYAELAAFYYNFVTHTPRPSLSWLLTSNNTLTITASTRPARVFIWSCENPKARDFRFDQTGAAWMSRELTPKDDTGLTYELPLENPAQGYRATMVEFTFPPPSPAVPPMVMTTRVFVTPDELPFKLEAPK